jgi:hypothetical protein
VQDVWRSSFVWFQFTLTTQPDGRPMILIPVALDGRELIDTLLIIEAR